MTQRQTRLHPLIALLGALFALLPTVDADNRLFIPPQEIRGPAENQELFIHVNSDVDLLAVSVSISFDPAKVHVVSIEPAGVAADAEWEPGSFGDLLIDNSTGEVHYGFLTELGFSEPADNAIPAGTDMVVARMVVTTLADTRTTALFDLRDGLGDNPFTAINALVDTTGDTIRPSLFDGFVTIDPFSPTIQSISDNQGLPGNTFLVVGRNFDKSALQVTVCGNPAGFSVGAGGVTLTVTAPACDTASWAEIEIFNDFGCATNPNGFLYEDTGDDFLRGDVDLSEAADITDALRIVQLLFVGIAIDGCEDAADVDDNGALDIVDPMRLLFALFGGAPLPPAPFPVAGPDPTPDALRVCE
jgi:hypothetical protein